MAMRESKAGASTENRAEIRSNLPEMTVTELSAELKRTVEEKFSYVRLRGEVMSYRGPHSSGHVYFCLKDAGARIDAIIWKGNFARLKFKPEEGLEVVVTGKVTTYPGKSTYQIVIDSLEPAGAGALMALLEERKKKLKAEGLFDEARKKPLPYLPVVIGVVTSPTGAVIRDILHRLTDRFPRRVLVWPVRVQGETCAAEVAAAIEGFNALKAGGAIPRPDVLIVARGGGSLEDLWGFNEEIVARAAATSEIPLVSAVGHETDFTLIDFVSDRRAPTPTAAAEIVVPVRAELLATTASHAARLSGCLRRYFDKLKSELRGLARGIPSLDAILAMPRQKLDALGDRLPRALRANAHQHRVEFTRMAGRLTPMSLSARLERLRDRVRSLSQLVEAYSYHKVLNRGFALVRDAAGQTIRSAVRVVPGQPLDIEFADGRVGAVAEGKPLPRKPKSVSEGGGQKGGQGGLFD
jgi:exodeoxyribonuclease VII large subunit